jgi:hypothetical protein
MSFRRHRVILVAAAAGLALSPLRPAGAQSLRGSRASINRMYRQARAERLSFFETSARVRTAVASGLLVPLRPDSSIVLHEVGYPFTRPATHTFVQRLGPQYLAACGEPLVVTSAVRPATRQPANSTPRSVHPTGMAVDLRKPQVPGCLRWLRTTLLHLERAGLLEATEESAPAHFHVAVFLTPYARYASARAKTEARAVLASRAVPTAGVGNYKVREGDTLWGIARAHDTTVGAITSANDLAGETIQPGQALRLPPGG